jgi:hypothetical protein
MLGFSWFGVFLVLAASAKKSAANAAIFDIISLRTLRIYRCGRRVKYHP